ncbi:hypothetical protein HCC61_28625 [Streptomyces sp. HNM0575]|uniref:hypothetical protein n=1 Tax=Streptomyces sp. HNM0575 TaxID=2716338 RepID=UPI00145DAA6F|nr:hypothetical protein [Streptomyces sp. HNM0575]NLU76542.1 hypothetical protein [Streptomyces sp. HNM0575]
MGDHFKTDLGVLDQFVKTLNSSVKDLDDARTALSHVRGDQIGTSRLDKACDDFQEEWKYGAEQMSEMIGGIKEGVESNKKSYKEMETNLAKALNEMEQQGTSAGGK